MGMCPMIRHPLAKFALAVLNTRQPSVLARGTTDIVMWQSTYKVWCLSIGRFLPMSLDFYFFRIGFARKKQRQ